MVLDTTQLTLALAIVAGVLLLALVWILVLSIKQRGMRRRYAILQGRGRQSSLVDIVTQQNVDVQLLREDVKHLDEMLARQRRDLGSAIRHIAVVRYDAFGDMGGRLSFTAAMLDDAGNGVILTSLHGRTETRAYIKGVRGGTGETLAPEELQAIQAAMTQ